MTFWEFIQHAFSERGEPSSARIISGWLSVSSMALIWFIVRHAFYADHESAITWIGGLPAIVYALAAFSVSPFGIAKVASIWNKDGSGSVEITPKAKKEKDKKK